MLAVQWEVVGAFAAGADRNMSKLRQDVDLAASPVTSRDIAVCPGPRLG